MESVSLFSKIYGSGRPLIILHGLFGMGDNWVTHAKNWADLGWEVHAIDARNHGRSPHATVHNYDVMVEDTVQYLEAHGLENAVVLGHSMGGKTAMNLAVTHPDKVAGLIVVDIAPKAYPVHHQTYIDAMKSVPFSQIGSRKEVEAHLAKKVSSPGIRQFFLKSLYRPSKDTFAFRFNLDVLDNQLEFVGQELEFGYYMGPTLFISGAQSGYITEGDEEKIHEHFPNSDLEVIPEAGHWVHAEAREAFGQVVQSFLAQF